MKNQVIMGDNLEIMRNLPSESINLIYIDPPFGTGDIQRLNSKRGSKIVSSKQYLDLLTGDEFLNWLYIRLEEMHRLLTLDGSIYVHMDYRYTHHVRFMMDDIFGPERFLNEIIWAYDYGGRPKDRWPKKHDNILWYSKGPEWTFNKEDIDRIPYMAPGLVGPEKAARGKLPTDTWWLTIVPTNGKERTGYPTQKPLKLMERIIVASSNEGDLVADFFCGSGTTGVAAKKLGRNYLLVDVVQEAIGITTRRLDT